MKGDNMSRTKKKPYRGTRSIDKTCRSHGSCPYCQSNRIHKYKKSTPIDTLLTELDRNLDLAIHQDYSRYFKDRAYCIDDTMLCIGDD